MPRRYMVQVEEDSASGNGTSPRPASPALPVSASVLPPPRRRRGVFVDPVEEELVTENANNKKDVRINEKQESRSIKSTQQTSHPPEEPQPPPIQAPVPKLPEESVISRVPSERITRIVPEPIISTQPGSEAVTKFGTPEEQAFAASIKSAESQSVQSVSNARDDMRKIEGFYQRREAEWKKPPVTKNKWKIWKKRLIKSRKVLFLVVIVAIILGAAGSAALVVRADYQTIQRETTALAEDLQTGRFTSARERVGVLTQKEQRYRSLYRTVRPAVLFTQGTEKTTHLDQLFSVSEHGLRLASQGLTLYSDVEVAYKQFVGSQEGKTLDTVERLSGGFESLYSELSTFQAEVHQLGNPYNLTIISQAKSDLGQGLPRLRKYTLAAQKMSQVMPSLLAEGGEKNYLVLLQNNAELRSTGGFIGSFALVRIRDGKLQEFKVEDVYEADGQLQGYVTPPEEIVQYLGEEQWFLRDVNWSPDFPKVAQRAEWFLDKTLDTKVDGVIATNLSMVRKLLDVTGPLQLVDYDEVITQENLYERAEAHSELNFFPGSTQKKDFLSAIAQQLLDKVFYQQTNKVAMAQALLDSAEESELLISMNDLAVEEVLTTLGWTGALLTPDCPAPFNGQNCVVDTVMQVEANVGVNKANQYITRDVTHDVELLNDVARHTRTIHLTNTAESEAWPAGEYKTYLRLFVPIGSQLRGAELDGKPLDLTSFRVQQEDGKQVFGYFVRVPVKSSRTLQVFYETPLTEGYTTYSLFEQKQSGVWNTTVEHSLNVGQRNVVTVAPEPDEIKDRTLRFKTEFKTHEFFAAALE